jgi:hypothetical protein
MHSCAVLDPAGQNEPASHGFSGAASLGCEHREPAGHNVGFADPAGQ